MYYLAIEEYGFLMVLRGKESGKCTRNIRYAYPFTSWDQADKAGREMGKGKPYAVLSTKG